MSLTPDDVVLGVAPLFHITGLIAHLAVALLVPMPIVLGFRFDPSTTLDLIEPRRPTFTVGAITVFIALMNDASWPGRDLSSLTKVYSGGAPIAPSVVERFEREAGATSTTSTASPRPRRRRTASRWAPALRSTRPRARCRWGCRSSTRWSS